jgi:hypothetical protein
MDVEAGAALKQALGAVKIHESDQYRHPESLPLCIKTSQPEKTRRLSRSGSDRSMCLVVDGFCA